MLQQTNSDGFKKGEQYSFIRQRLFALFAFFRKFLCYSFNIGVMKTVCEGVHESLKAGEKHDIPI